jgi:hypothetical protein
MVVAMRVVKERYPLPPLGYSPLVPGFCYILGHCHVSVNILCKRKRMARGFPSRHFRSGLLFYDLRKSGTGNPVRPGFIGREGVVYGYASLSRTRFR